jgi:hypothetical protein
MPMQPDDVYDIKLQTSGLRQAAQANGNASKEFVTRLERYGQHLGKVKLQSGPAVELVVKGLTEEGDRWDTHRAELRKHFTPLIKEILDVEKRWFHNLCKAHESAEKFLADNKKLFLRHEELRGAPPKLERLVTQQKTIQAWSPSRAKWTNLERLKGKLDKAHELNNEILNLYGDSYFEGLRLYLRGAGFIVAPGYLPPAAVFPHEDWIPLESNGSKPAEELASVSDDLMKKYQILGTPYAGMLYKSNRPTDDSGCVCVSWVMARRVTDDKRVLVPVLGMSGKAPTAKNTAGIEAMLGACALPPYWNQTSKMFGFKPLDPVQNSNPEGLGFNQYYDDIMARANNLAINYRVRELLQLRLPSRQAMLSYLGLSFFAASRDQVATKGTLATPTPGVARWHSLNCAEPAALAWISSFFVDGQDVHLCCPYEGSDDPGALGLKPKETCPWCATVELAYRSLKKAPEKEQGQWSARFDESMRTGNWAREITVARKFEKTDTDMEGRVDLPRNKRTFEHAYPGAVNANVSVLREIFKEVGLLKKSTIREGLPALWQQTR